MLYKRVETTYPELPGEIDVHYERAGVLEHLRFAFWSVYRAIESKVLRFWSWLTFDNRIAKAYHWTYNRKLCWVDGCTLSEGSYVVCRKGRVVITGGMFLGGGPKGCVVVGDDQPADGLQRVVCKPGDRIRGLTFVNTCLILEGAEAQNRRQARRRPH